MNLAEFSIRNRTTVLVLTAVLLFGGAASFYQLSWLEDPEFTIKEALVLTPYPGATAEEVEEEVSDRIEQAVQKLGQLKEVESKSDRGLSTVTVRIKDQYDRSSLPQVWDELRRKVNDVQSQLPPGAGPSIVNDDFGDVYGVFIAIYGPEYSYAELREFAKLLRRELLLVQDVAKIDFWGDFKEALYVEPDRDRMSQLGILPHQIIQSLTDRNVVANSGRVQVGKEYIAISPTGTFDSEKEIEDLLIIGHGSDQQIYLRDVATVRRGYQEPQQKILRYDGNVAIGLGISTVSGGNVVTMGEAVEKRARELLPRTPLGIESGIVSVQSQAVTVAIEGFLVSLAQAVLIVVAVLLLFMGVRSGLLIGFVLVITISGTFVFMGPWNIALERISLGALIIALGMLVDNAIVVVDGTLVRIQKGMKPGEAASEVVQQTALPLLGATAVAIMAFGAIGLSDDSTGEFCRSLFQVVLIALGLSWITAVSVTPVLCVMFLKPNQAQDGVDNEEQRDPYGGALYTAYRGLLGFCIRRRWLSIMVVLVIFGASLYGFQFISKSFFPDSTRPQFTVDFWLPQGTHIDETVTAAGEVEKYLLDIEAVTHVTSMVGAGGLRFLLTYQPEKLNSAYVQFLVDVDDYLAIDELMPRIEEEVQDLYPDALIYAKRFLLGPGSAKLQARVSGPDLTVLREVASRIEEIMLEDGGAKAIRSDWREQVKLLQPVMAEEEANRAGIGRPDVAGALLSAFEGQRLGVFRERDELLPILMRAPERERGDVASINSIQIWSPAAGQAIPLRQVVSDFDTVYENEIIQRLNRKRTITVLAEPKTEPASTVFERFRPKVEAIELGPEYELEWWGEYRDSSRAQAGIAASLPFFLLTMVLVVIALFNALRQPLAIFLCVPLSIIGVTLGLLATGQPFGFMALLGFMSLSGMLIKNAIVLIDEIEIQKKQTDSLYQAVVESGVSRLRPVSMAALTTALGMVPLLFDAFFIAMAVTIIFGLIVATVLTMVVIPVFYAVLFKIPAPAKN